MNRCLELSVRRDLPGFTLDLSFAAGPGCLAILGASGCGKSMTLRAAAGIVRPDRGRIVLDGRVLFDSAAGIDLPPRRRRVGVLFQSYALFPNMTVAENIAAGLRGISRGEAARRVGELVRRFRLAGLEERYPAQLSGGQQQRTALARLLAWEPEAILLDEPFSALDATLREELLPELRQLLAEYPGVSVLVTHSREEALRLSSRLLVLEEGRVSASGETRQVFRDPGTVQAARLTGCRNIAPARAAGERLVEVPSWGVLLQTARPLPPDLTHVGVRPESLRPAGRDDPNAIPLHMPERLEGAVPGRGQLLFSPAPASEARLWWEPGLLPEQLPPALAVPQEGVLGLRG